MKTPFYMGSARDEMSFSLSMGDRLDGRAIVETDDRQADDVDLFYESEPTGLFPIRIQRGMGRGYSNEGLARWCHNSGLSLVCIDHSVVAEGLRSPQSNPSSRG